MAYQFDLKTRAEFNLPVRSEDSPSTNAGGRRRPRSGFCLWKRSCSFCRPYLLCLSTQRTEDCNDSDPTRNAEKSTPACSSSASSPSSASSKSCSLLSLLVFDVVGSVFRLSSRWYPQRLVMQIAHLGRRTSLVIEGWTHGFKYSIVRSAIKTFFGGRSRRVETLPGVENQRRA